jgi:oxygen-independent coproporphyrinogen-3 oxidase
MITPHESQAAPSAAFNLDLIQEILDPGPRYTSYPPATQFTADLTDLRLEEAIAADNLVSARPISLYFHLPFCETRCWFCGCNTVVTRRRGAAAEYLDDLATEVGLDNRPDGSPPPRHPDPPGRRDADFFPA